MNTTDATLTNGRYELPAHARGVLVLADPPEAGWRIESPTDEAGEPEAEPVGGFGCEFDPRKSRELATTSPAAK